MQLHPDAAPEAMRHAVESLAAGYIGLDFAEINALIRVKRRGGRSKNTFQQHASIVESVTHIPVGDGGHGVW